MINTLLKTIGCLVLFLLFACESGQDYSIAKAVVTSEKASKQAENKFDKYWYSGTAELNSYELKQARYGEIRDGEVVLVFVTEPFSLSKQVKLDNPQNAGKDKVSVMKLNQIRKFNTGIYDYSVMTSTFTPINAENYPYTLKSTTSVQEWCGNTFAQLNLDGNKYQFKDFSYFESEGDRIKKLSVTLLEEDLMTRIRINQGQLPEGAITLIPSTLQSRFANQEISPAKATISKKVSAGTINYEVKYLNNDRKITLEVEQDFPNKIIGWTEDNGDGLITTARLKKSINTPYWNEKSLADESKRLDLQLVK